MRTFHAPAAQRLAVGVSAGETTTLDQEHAHSKENHAQQYKDYGA